MSVKSPVLKYYGSKFRIGQWVIEHFPKHRHYVEPFGGAANVLLLKQPSRLETYNDLNGRIVNFFRVLRDEPEALIRQINLTPWARDEYEFCLCEPEAEDRIERARRLFFHLWMNYNGAYITAKGSWRRHKNGRRSVTSDIKPENLFEASKRFLKIQIENRDAFKLINEFDSPDTLFYLDPPYVFSTRSTKKAYTFEMTNAQHREFAELLYSLKGFVVLSGYASPVYEELFERRGWQRKDKAALTMAKTKQMESLWLSPQTFKALQA